MAISFALITDDCKNLPNFQTFVQACAAQTISPVKLVVDTSAHQLPVQNLPMLIEHQRTAKNTTITARILNTLSRASGEYLVIFLGVDYIPDPFFCERTGFHTARVSPDVIFYDPEPSLESNLAFSCLGSGTPFLYRPESLAVGIRLAKYGKQSNFMIPDVSHSASSKVTKLISSVGSRLTIGRDQDLFNDALARIFASTPPEYALALKALVHPKQISVRDSQSNNGERRIFWHRIGPDRRDLGESRPLSCLAQSSIPNGSVEEIGDYSDGNSESQQSSRRKHCTIGSESKYSDRELVEHSQFFDCDLYRANYFFHEQTTTDAISHFLERGWREVRETSKYFSLDRYLLANGDVRDARINPLVHYLRYGRAEGRSRWGKNGEVSGAEEAHLLSSALFDAEYYLAQNGDLAGQDIDPIWHFLKFGGFEGRNPSVYFDARWYLAENSDLAHAEINPLLHYVLVGKEEGRQIRPANDAPWRSRLAGRPRMTDRMEWRLDAATGESASSWLMHSEVSQGRKARVLCCLPYLVRDNLTLRLMDQAKNRGVSALLTVQHPTPKSYAEDNGPWSRSVESVLRLYQVAEEQSYPDLIAHLIRSRGIDTLLIAGASDLYPMLPRLKDEFKNLFVIDQLFNTTGHTRLSLTFSPYIDKYIVESEAMSSFLSDRGIGKDNISKLFSGIDLNHFSRREINNETVSAFRSKIGFDDSISFIVGYVGRLSPEKNPMGFLHIAREVLSRRSDVGFFIAGGGPMLDTVTTEVNRYFPSSNVKVVGFVDDVRQAMTAADLLIVPSHVDGRPNAIMEANALGVPVLGSAIGGINELIESGVNGFLVRSGAYSDFASRICDIVADPEGYESLCCSTVNSALNNFDQSPMYDNFVKIIVGSLNENRGPQTK